MLVTHGGGKAKRFNCVLQDDYVKIKNENGRQEEYPLGEIFDVMNWLTEKFGLSCFPLQKKGDVVSQVETNLTGSWNSINLAPCLGEHVLGKIEKAHSKQYQLS